MRANEYLQRVLELRASRDYAAARELANSAVDAAGDVQARAGLLIELGRLEEERGLYDQAAATFDRARRLSAAAPELRARAAAGLVLALGGLVRYDEAGRVAAQALREAQAVLAPDCPALMWLLVEAGSLATAIDDHPRAQGLLEEALAAARAAPAGRDRDELIIAALCALGTLRWMQGRYGDGEQLLLEAVALSEQSFGRKSIESAMTNNALGVLFKFSGKFDESEQAYLRSLAAFESAIGPDAAPLANLHHNLGGLAHSRRDFAAGEPYARRSVEIREAALGPDHAHVAIDKAAHAALLAEIDRAGEAERLLREAIPVLEHNLGPDHREVAVYTNNLAAILQRRGEPAAAEALYRRSLAIKESLLGGDGPQLAGTLNNLAVVLKAQGHYQEAAALYERAIAALEGQVEPDHPTLRSARTNYAKLRDAADIQQL